MSCVPKYNNLSFYAKPEDHKVRYDSLLKFYEQKFHERPHFVARAPGRVNIIGDHIDYNQFSSLPMAIDVDLVVAGSVNNSTKIKIINIDPSFTAEEIELPQDGSVVAIDKVHHSWGNYFKCSLIVAHNYIKEKYPDLVMGGTKPLKGMTLAFSGTVPTGGGLSSSAAFCVASTMSILKANGIESIPKQDLCRITVVSEHYVGVNTGGMDQCASIYGEKNKALLIEYTPKLLGVPFSMPTTSPNNMVFLITNSLFQANKHDTAPIGYNLRVVETAIAADILAHKFDLTLPSNSNLKTGTLRGFMDAYYEKRLEQEKWNERDFLTGAERLESLLELTETIFSDEQKVGFTTEDASKELGLSVDEFTKKYLTLINVRFTKLKIYQRIRHVFADSLRVLQCLKLFDEFVPERSEDFLERFGTLLNASHASAAIFNDSSVPDVDRIVQISLASGSYGARITGAGFGGSVVHLTTVDKLPLLISSLKKEFYRYKFPNITEEELDDAIIVSYPASGACFVEY